MDGTGFVNQDQDVASLLGNEWVVELHLLSWSDECVNVVLISWDVFGWWNLHRELLLLGQRVLVSKGEILCVLQEGELKLVSAHEFSL